MAEEQVTSGAAASNAEERLGEFLREPPRAAPTPPPAAAVPEPVRTAAPAAPAASPAPAADAPTTGPAEEPPRAARLMVASADLPERRPGTAAAESGYAVNDRVQVRSAGRWVAGAIVEASGPFPRVRLDDSDGFSSERPFPLAFIRPLTPELEAAAAVAAAADPLRVGTRVEASRGREWRTGEVVGGGRSPLVRFDEARRNRPEENISRSRLRPLTPELEEAIAAAAAPRVGDRVDVELFGVWSTGRVVSIADPWIEVQADPSPDDATPSPRRFFEHQVRPLPEGFAPRRLELDPRD